MLKITTNQTESLTVIALSGRLDVLTSKDLREAIFAQVEAGRTLIVLELSQLDYVSSAGLRVLLEGRKALKAKSGVLSLAGVTPFVREVLVSTGFNSIFAIFEKPGDALTAK